MPLSPGVRVGRFEILAPLGPGGMGEVYRARDMWLPRDVARKVLPDTFARDPERVARFEGEDLAQPIAGGAIPLDKALPIARQIAEALEKDPSRRIRPNYDLSRDGRRSVIVRRKNFVMPRVIHVVLNRPQAPGVHAEGAVR